MGTPTNVFNLFRSYISNWTCRLLENNNTFPLYYYNNLSVSLLKTNSIEVHNLLAIPQSTPTVNSNFSSSKNSFQRKTISYICGLRARSECEPFSEHSPRSDRVTNIGYCLPLEASVLSSTNYYLILKTMYWRRYPSPTIYKRRAIKLIYRHNWRIS